MSDFSRFDIVSAGATDIGKLRKLNEDAWIGRPDIGLWAVADGMGGHQSGDLASRTIVDLLAGIAPPDDLTSLRANVREAILQANLALRNEATRRGSGTVIGATIVALMTHGTHFACLWAGDSRLYRFRKGMLEQISHDHSPVQEMVDAGILAADAAERHPMANVISRAVGAHDALQLEEVSEIIAAGDIFLVCTDGLTKMVSDAEIAAIMRSVALANQPEALIAAALDHGGKDNVTAVVVGAFER